MAQLNLFFCAPKQQQQQQQPWNLPDDGETLFGEEVALADETCVTFLITNSARLPSGRPRNACLSSRWHFQLGVRRAPARHESLDRGSSRRTGGEGVWGGLLFTSSCARSATPGRKDVYYQWIPRSGAAPGFLFSQTAQFWPGFIFVFSFAQEGSFFFYISWLRYAQAWLHVYLKPMKDRRTRAKDLTVAHRLPNKDCGVQSRCQLSAMERESISTGLAAAKNGRCCRDFDSLVNCNLPLFSFFS